MIWPGVFQFAFTLNGEGCRAGRHEHIDTSTSNFTNLRACDVSELAGVQPGSEVVGEDRLQRQFLPRFRPKEVVALCDRHSLRRIQTARLESQRQCQQD